MTGAFATHMNLFPLYQSFGGKSEARREKIMTTSWIAILVLYTVYMGFSFCVVYEFGSSLKHSVLDSIMEQKKLTSSLFIRIIYMIGVICHIPFLFFSLKESVLIVMEETWNKSLSTQIETALQEFEEE